MTEKERASCKQMRQLAFKKCETAIELYKDINEIPYERDMTVFMRR